MRAVLGGDNADFMQRAVGLDGKHLFLVFVTIAAALACMCCYASSRCCRMAYQKSFGRPVISPEIAKIIRESAATSKARTVTGMGQLKPIRVAANEEEQLGLSANAEVEQA